VLPKLINEDQSGFIRGRYIGDNIRLTYDMIEYLDRRNLPGLLVNLDFEKAFDSLSWSFMKKVLKAFGFGENIQKWIHVFYIEICSTVIVNGQASDWFKIGRGCRQGDPVSSYLYVLCAEILANMIRENDSIKGTNINNDEHKISQYADDTELTLEGDQKSFEICIDTLDTFGKRSGVFLDSDKSSAMWLGCRKNCNTKYMQHLGMAWNPPRVKILRVWFTNNLKQIAELNYNEKFYEVRKLFNVWSRRNITPLGRVAVLKSLILSKLIHLWMLLPKPPDHLINELQKMCFKFIWNQKPNKINRKIAIKTLSNGGVGIPDIKQFISALKLTWLRKYELCKHNWKNVLRAEFRYIDNIEKFGPEIIKLYRGKSAFWLEVFESYRIFFL
jgi:hypothetical protein